MAAAANAQVGAKVRDILEELAKANEELKRLKEANEELIQLKATEPKVDKREVLRKFVINMTGWLAKFLKDVDGNLFTYGSAVSYIFGECDALPNDLDACIAIPRSDNQYFRMLKDLKKSQKFIMLFFHLKDLIGTTLFEDWQLKGIRDDTVKGHVQGSNARLDCLKDNPHFVLTLVHPVWGILKFSLLGVFPFRDGNLTHDFIHADDCWSPIMGRMPMSSICHRPPPSGLGHLVVTVSHDTKTAWWIRKQWDDLLRGIPRQDRIPDELKDVAEFLLPQVINDHEDFTRWSQFLYGLIRFLMRSKIESKGYSLVGGIPLIKSDEETSLNAEAVGTYVLPCCMNGHSLSFGEILQLIEGNVNTGRQNVCPMCRTRLFFCKWKTPSERMEELVKRTYPGFANPLKLDEDCISFGEQAPADPHNFGDIFKVMKEIDERAVNRTQAETGSASPVQGPIFGSHHHSHS